MCNGIRKREITNESGFYFWQQVSFKLFKRKIIIFSSKMINVNETVNLLHFQRHRDTETNTGKWYVELDLKILPLAAI